jgi:protein-tyrosine phosphatase
MAAPEPQLWRRLALPGTTNVRDVGGYAAEAGLVVASGRLLRGEVVTRQDGTESRHGTWHPRDSGAYRALGVATVIDLRSDREVETTRSAWPEATGARTVRVPIAEGGEGADTDFVRQLLSGARQRFSEADLTGFYVDTFRTRAPLFVEIVEIVSAAEHLPAMIHCTAGKDRTGLAVALVMELVGCHRDDVVAEYALTGALRPNRVAAYASLFDEAGVDPDVARALFETPSRSMRDALAHVDEHFGGAAGLLRQLGGMSAQTHDRLKQSLLVAATADPGRLSSERTTLDGKG